MTLGLPTGLPESRTSRRGPGGPIVLTIGPGPDDKSGMVVPGRPFQLALDEARELVRPDPLEDVLETLLKEGVLYRFEIGQHYLFVWPSHRIDAVQIFTGFNPSSRNGSLRPSERRPCALKKGRR